MKTNNELVTQIAIYLDVNVYQLFRLARIFIKGEDIERARVEYEEFIRDGTVPPHVAEYCELVVTSIE